MVRQKTGRELRNSVAELLAWQRVARDIDEGLLGGEFTDANRGEVQAKVREANRDAREEVWASYRFAALLDNQADDGLKVIDLGIGHAGNGNTLGARIVAALKSEALLSDTVSAGHIGRNWPPAFEESGAWPLSSLRQSFLNGALTRLPDPDSVLQGKIPEFVQLGEFGLASGEMVGGGYERIWYGEVVPAEEVAFENGVFLLTKVKAEELRRKTTVIEPPEPPSGPPGGDDWRGDPVGPEPTPDPPEPVPPPAGQKATLSLTGSVPRESWNRVGTRLLPKLQGSEDISVKVELSASVDAEQAQNMAAELRQALEDLGLNWQVNISRT